LHGIRVSAILALVIVSFADRATGALYHGERTGPVKRCPPEIRQVALRKLDMLNAAGALLDLRSPPGNRLEALRGDLLGLHSIRVNDQWRIVFRWTATGPAEVRLIDYHS
jgi:proteic killer suppression protein